MITQTRVKEHPEVFAWLTRDAEKPVAVAGRSTPDQAAIPVGTLVQVRRGNRLVGAVCALELAPGIVRLLPPRLADGVPASTLGRMLDYAVQLPLVAEARLVTAYIALDQREVMDRLQQAGFNRSRDLLVMQRPLCDLPLPPLDQPLEIEPDSPSLHARFRLMLKSTRRGGMDYPELNRHISIDDTLCVHRREASKAKRQYYLAVEHDRDVGILILAIHSTSRCAELTYIGVPPELRQRGIGTRILDQAIHWSREFGADSLVLAVDSGNDAAISLYARAKFEQVSREAVFWSSRPLL